MLFLSEICSQPFSRQKGYYMKRTNLIFSSIFLTLIILLATGASSAEASSINYTQTNPAGNVCKVACVQVTGLPSNSTNVWINNATATPTGGGTFAARVAVDKVIGCVILVKVVYNANGKCRWKTLRLKVNR